MAKKEFKFDGMDFDKGLDLSFDMQPKSLSQMSKREIVTESVSGIYDGAKANLADIDRWKDSFRDKLPKSYKTAWDGFDETTRSLGDLYNQAEKEIKPVLGQISNKLDGFVSEDSTFFKGITRKMKDMFYDGPKAGGSSQEQIMETGVQNMLNETFSQMQQQRTEESIRSEANEKVHEVTRDKIEKDRHDETIRLFSRIDDKMSRLMAYREGAGISIDKKKLELSFRKYMVLGQIHQEQKRLGDLFKNQFEAIRINTSLPEYKKISASDRFMEKMKTSATDGIYNKMFAEGSILKSGLKRLQKDAMDTIRNVGDGLRMGLMGLDGADLIAGDGAMDSLPASIGKIVGGEISNVVREKAMKPLMERLGKDKDFTRIGEQVRRYALNPRYGLDDLKKTNTWEKAMESGYSSEIESAFSYIRDAFRVEEGKKGVDTGQGFRGMEQPEVYSRRSAIVQNEVVPGYLARILREITRFRLKKEEVPLLHFDPITGKFKNDSEIQREIKRLIRTEARSDLSASFAKTSADEIVKSVSGDETHSRKVAELLYELSSSSAPLKAGSIQNSDVYNKANKEVKETLDRLASRINTETEEGYKLVGDIEESLAGIRNSASSHGVTIQQLIDSGLKNQLEDAGFVQRDESGKFQLNDKKIGSYKRRGLLSAYSSLDALSPEERKKRLEETEARQKLEANENRAKGIWDKVTGKKSSELVSTEGSASSGPIGDSDVELKRGFVSFDANHALEGVKNIPISSWEYKNPEKHGAGRKIGGMAQDIYKQFGQEAAPYGKKIDLVSMTGINMSAIQGLAKQQNRIEEKLQSNHTEEMDQSTPGGSLVLLSKINQNIFEMHETLKSKNFALTLPNLDFSKIDINELMTKGMENAKHLKDKASETAQPLIRTGNFYIDMIQSMAVKGLNDVYGGLTSTAKMGYKGFTKTKEFFADFWTQNKEDFKNRRDQFFRATMDLGLKALDFGKKTIFETIPQSIVEGWGGLKRLKENLKSVVSGPRDIYIRGSTSPVIRAERMRHGMYMDSATGQILLSTDSLLKSQGDIVDIGKDHEVALTKSELSDGVYDQHGNKLETLGVIAKAALVAGSKMVLNKAIQGVQGLVNWWNEPSKVGEMLKGAWNGFVEKMTGFGGFSFHDKRQINVLVQIRDLLAIGKRKKLVEHVYSRDPEDDSFIPGNSFLRLLFGDKFKRGINTTDRQSPEDTGSDTSGSSSDSKSGGSGYGNSTNVEASLVNFFKRFGIDFKDTKNQFLQGLPGSQQFVGPIQPNARRGLAALPGGEAAKGFLSRMGFDGLKNRFSQSQEFLKGLRDGTIVYDKELKNYVTYDENDQAVPYFDIEKKSGFFDRRSQRKTEKAYFDENFVGPQKIKPGLFSRLSQVFKRQHPEDGDSESQTLEAPRERRVRKSYTDMMMERLVAESQEKNPNWRERLFGAKKKISDKYLDIKNRLLDAKDTALLPPEEQHSRQSFTEMMTERLMKESGKNRPGIKQRLLNVKKSLSDKYLDTKDRLLDAKDLAMTTPEEREVRENYTDMMMGRLSKESGKNKPGFKQRFLDAKNYLGDKYLGSKDKVLDVKDKALELASDPRTAGKRIVDALNTIAKKITAVKVPEEVSIGSDVGPGMTDFMGPPSEKRRGIKGVMANALTNLKGFGSKAWGSMKGLGSLAGAAFGGIGKLLGGLIGPTTDDVSNNDFGTALSKTGSIGPAIKGLGDGIRGLNDKDGDGERDGGSTEMLRQQQEENKQRKDEEAKKAEEAAKRASESSLKYKSQQNAIDRLLSGAGGLLKMMGSGIGGIFSLATSALGAIPGIGKLLLGLGKGGALLAGAAAKGVLNAGKLAGKTVLNTVKNHGLKGAAMRGLSSVARVGLATSSMTGTLVAGVATVAKGALAVVLSPLFLKAAAVGAVAYGAYKTYKYFTRNKTDDFEKLRLVQYGFPDEHSDQHRILALENYFLDGRISPHHGGSFLKQSIKPEELLEIFEINPDDKPRVESFFLWLNERFKPFFLKHISAIFKANPKVPLNEVKKLSYSELQKYLDEAQNLEGPYNTEESPFTDGSVVDTKEAISPIIEKLRASKKKEDEKKISNIGAVTKNPENIAKVAQAKKDAEAEALRKKTQASTEGTKLDITGMEQKPTAQGQKGPGPQQQKLQAAANQANLTQKSTGNKEEPPPSEVGDDAGEPPRAVSGTFRNRPQKGGSGVSVGNLPVAKGPLARADDGERYIKLANKVNINGLNPVVKRYLLSMAAEYGALTGKQILLTDGFRSYEEQAALYRKMPGKAARPGNSMHEFGLAFDMDSKNANELESLGLMRKYGFTRPIGGEAWHLEMAGHQLNVQKAKKDLQWANTQSEASLGRGGGGYGSKPGGTMKRRNNDVALAVWNSTSQTAVDNKPSQEDLDRGSSPTAPVRTAANDEQMRPRKAPGRLPSLGAGEFAKRTPTTPRPTASGGAPSIPGYTPEFKSNTPKGLDISSPTAEGETPPSTSGGTQTGSTGMMQAKFTPGQKMTVEQTKEQVKKAASKVGMPQNDLLLFAAAESSMGQKQSPHAGSAKGPFQFMPKTWKEQLGKHGKKYDLGPDAHVEDPYASGVIAGAYLKQNEGGIRSIKPQPDIVDFYLSHMLGPGGVKTFLRLRPQDIAATVMTQAAKYNPNVFYKDPKNLKDPRTAAEVRQFTVEKFRKLSKDFGIQANIGADSFKPEAVNDNTSAANDPMIRNPDKNPIQTQNQGGFMRTNHRSQESTTGNTASLDTPAPKSTRNREPAFEPPVNKETLTGRPDIASGVTEAITRTADATSQLLTTVQNDVVPVLRGMHEVLKNIYESGSMKAKAETPEKDVPKSSNASTSKKLQANGSMLNRERSYGT